MTDDRQTFAIGETIRQKHLDAVARDADRIATQQEAIAEARAELWTALNYVTNPEDAPIIKKLDTLLSKHGERT